LEKVFVSAPRHDCRAKKQKYPPAGKMQKQNRIFHSFLGGFSGQKNNFSSSNILLAVTRAV
jgi:hypothetical protein